MLVGSGVAFFILKLVVCEFYDEYEYSDGYHDNSYGYYVEEPLTFRSGNDTGRVRRFGEMSGTPHTRKYEDIKEVLQKIMPGHTELFQDLFQPQMIAQEAPTEPPSPNQYDTSSSPQFDTPSLYQYKVSSHRYNPPSSRPFVPPKRSQYSVFEEVTSETALQNLEETEETEAVMPGLTPEEPTSTPWFWKQVEQTTPKTSTETMWLTMNSLEMSLTLKPNRSTTHAFVRSKTQESVTAMTHLPFSTTSYIRSTTRKLITTHIPMRSTIGMPVRSYKRTTTRVPVKSHKLIRSTTHKLLRSTTHIPVRSTRLPTRSQVPKRSKVSSTPSTTKSSTVTVMDIQQREFTPSDLDRNTSLLYPMMMMDRDIYEEGDAIPDLHDEAWGSAQLRFSKEKVNSNVSRREGNSNQLTTTMSNPTELYAPEPIEQQTSTFHPIKQQTPTTTLDLIQQQTTTTLNPIQQQTTTLNLIQQTTTTKLNPIQQRTTTTKLDPSQVVPNTSTPKPLVFDIESFLLVLANLTYDYDTNLTEIMNITLRNNTPTCRPEEYYAKKYNLLSNMTTTSTTTEPAYEAPKSLNNSVVAKCFVCGLKTPGIPYDSDCADAFAGDFLPLTPINPLAKAKTSSYRKYCRYGEIYNYHENASRPRSIYGRWTGGCSVRWTDLSGLYTQRSCRNRKRPVTGLHYASKRMAKLEMSLGHTEEGCIISPVATLLPLSRGISLFARFHVCVCTGNWCNGAVYAIPTVVAVITPVVVSVYR